jgi:hypothetical protein
MLTPCRIALRWIAMQDFTIGQVFEKRLAGSAIGDVPAGEHESERAAESVG